MMRTANRLDNIKEYYFSKKLREVQSLITKGKPIINLGIGSPDLAPHTDVIEAIQKSLVEPTAHKYQSYKGIPGFKEAVAVFYKNKFNTSVNADTEILPLMGSKEGILLTSLAFLNKGDAVLVPNPGYPTYISASNMVEAKIIDYKLCEANNYQPDFEALEKLDLRSVKIMWVNYPHMPTGAKATDQSMKQLIEFGRRHNILIINDNPYSFIINNKPKSILEYVNNDDNVLELNSLSKTFNMAGWRVGMILGKANLITEILKVKTQMDSGMFYGIQKGAIAALNLPDEWYEHINKIYIDRREYIWQLAELLDCKVNKHDASGMFVWAKIKEGKKAETMVDELLYEKNIFVAPGTVFGTQGEGYIRFALCTPIKGKGGIMEAIERCK